MWILVPTPSSEWHARWRYWLSEFAIGVLHGAEIKNQVADAIAPLITARNDRSLQKDNSTLHAIDDYNDPCIMMYTFSHDEKHPRPLLGINPSSDKIQQDPLPGVKILRAQQQDNLCRTAAIHVGQRSCKSAVNKVNFVVRKGHTDGAIQILLPPSLRQRVLTMSYNPPIAGCPGQRRMYDTLKIAFYSSHRSADFDNIVKVA